ncbi:MAG TPA: NUDIX domain-containing protein [Candidatus Limnocylindrales bacterium]|nr:NUDIX domain-containing protein [Candidatus Limnocylindrales bacterium]
MTLRPDIVECWPFRVTGPGELEILLIRRAPDRIFPGLWQCVTGAIDPGERVALAALRELEEETGFGADDVEAAYDLDQVAPFYDEGTDGVVVSAIFAARIRPGATERMSREHDGAQWVRPEAALRLAVWPSYAESIRRIREILLDPDLEPWFRLDGHGERIARRPLR